MAKQELVVIKPDQYAVFKSDTAKMLEVVRANAGDRGMNQFDMDRIKVPAGGGMAWNVPTLEGMEIAQAIDGVIVAFKDVRGYWPTSFEDQPGTPPACASNDAKVGRGDPGGSCVDCPLAEFGTARGKKEGTKGRGQACRQSRLLFVLRPNMFLPTVLAVPPSSLGECYKYFNRLSSHMMPYFGVITRLGLEETKSKDGIKFSAIRMSMQGKLDDKQIRFVQQMAQAMGATFNTIDLQQDDAAA